MSPWYDLLPALSQDASQAPEDTYLPTWNACLTT